MGIDFIKGFVGTRDPLIGGDIDSLRQRVLEDYKSTVFSGKTTGNPPLEDP